MSKRSWRILKFYSIGWTLSMLFLVIVRGVGTEELGQLKFDFKIRYNYWTNARAYFGYHFWANLYLGRKKTVSKTHFRQAFAFKDLICLPFYHFHDFCGLLGL